MKWTVHNLTEALSKFPPDQVVDIDQGCGCCSSGDKGIWKEGKEEPGVVVIGYCPKP